MGVFFGYGLAGIMARLSAERLEGIQRLWEIDPSLLPQPAAFTRDARHATLEKIAAAMATPWAAMSVVEKLNPLQRKLLNAILSSEGNAIRIESLVTISKSEAALQRALTPLLEGVALVILPSDDVFSDAQAWNPESPLKLRTRVTVYRTLKPAMARAMDLYETPADDLRALPLANLIAASGLAALPAQLGLSGVGGIGRAMRDPGREAALAAINLRHPEVIQKLLKQSSASARRIFRELVKSGGVVALHDLLAGPDSRPQELLPTLISLGSAGLIFPAFELGRRACFVHPEALPAARGEEPHLPEVSDELVPSPPPYERSDMGLNVWWNMMVMALYIKTGDAKLTRVGDVPRRVTDRLGKLMAAHVDFEPFELAEEALQALQNSDNIRRDGERLALSPEFAQIEGMGFVGQASQLLAGWLRSTPVEYERPLGIPGVDHYVTAVQQLRRTLLRWLGEIPAGEWFNAADFARRILAREPFFLRSRSSILKKLGPAGIQDLYESWNFQEGLVLYQEMQDMPHMLGLVELGWPENDRDVLQEYFFRVTDHGARVFPSMEIVVGTTGNLRAQLRAGAADPPPGRTLLIQPSMEMILMEFDPRVAYAVGRFAQPVGFDRVGTFLLSSEAVRSAANRGMTASQMMDILNRFSAQPVPQNVEYQVRDWASSIRGVRFERATVVEVDSPADLDVLLSSKPMRSRLRRRLSPTAALISVGADIDALGKALEPAGFRWNPPEDWEKLEQATYTAVHRTLKRFDKSRRGWE